MKRMTSERAFAIVASAMLDLKELREIEDLEAEEEHEHTPTYDAINEAMNTLIRHIINKE